MGDGFNVLMSGIGVSNGCAFSHEGYGPALWVVVNDLYFSPSCTIWTMGARFQVSGVHMFLRNKGVDVNGLVLDGLEACFSSGLCVWYVSVIDKPLGSLICTACSSQ